MALIGNRSVINKSPGRFLAGTVASGDRSAFNKPGMMAGAFQSLDVLSGWPSGHLSPSAWMLPRAAGAMSSRNVAELDVTASGSGAMGVNGVGSADVQFTADATGSLIASGSGSAIVNFTASGNIVATLGVPGSATFSFTASGLMEAKGWASASASVLFSASAIPSAIGNMIGSSLPAAEADAQIIAAAVWNYQQ